MKLLLAVTALSFAGALNLLADDSRSGKATLATVSWLTGVWNSDVNGRQITERWMAPAGGTMLGMSRTVVGGKTAEYGISGFAGGKARRSELRGETFGTT